jgi:hypothetical protein
MNLLYPKIRLNQLPAILAHAAVGAVCAAIYGILHDQITYSISPEYFTRLKFAQFQFANFGLPRRLFVAEVGILATWWVGFVAGWFIARKTVPRFPPRIAFQKSLVSFVIIFVVALFAGAAGYVLGRLRGPDADFSSWDYFASAYGVEDLPNFVRVAYIHNAGYLGGFLGLIIALLWLRQQYPAPVSGDLNHGQPHRA